MINNYQGIRVWILSEIAANLTEMRKVGNIDNKVFFFSYQQFSHGISRGSSPEHNFRSQFE